MWLLFFLFGFFVTVTLEGKPAWGSWTKAYGKFGCLSFELGVLMEEDKYGLAHTKLGQGSRRWPLPYEVDRLEVT